jgi:transforming growth factor-beta-induced protein
MQRLSLVAILAVSSAKGVELPATKNIVELAESVKDLSTLVSAVVAGGLADTLSSPGPFTVFAPTNEAFAALPAGVVAKLLKPENKKELADILTYHVLPEKVLSTDLKPFQEVKTVEGKALRVSKFEGEVRVDRAKVIKADNLASNGVVHVIDAVLLPLAAPSLNQISATKNIVQLAESVKDLSTLVTAVVAGGLADTLSSPGPFTVFAPTNEAFAALPAGVVAKLLKPENKKELADILTYHVLSGNVLSTDLKPFQEVKTVEGKSLRVSKFEGEVRVNRAKVIKADNFASNGVVHIIDAVLLPLAAPILDQISATKNIVQLAESVKDLSTLVTAVVAGGLADTLSSPGPFTVFAPTNEAFAALPAGVVAKLLKPENKKELVDILTYHVLPEQVLSTDLKPFQEVKTVAGKAVRVIKFDGEVRVDRAKVIKADNLASNGVVHIIDGVLLPPSEAIVV